MLLFCHINFVSGVVKDEHTHTHTTHTDYSMRAEGNHCIELQVFKEQLQKSMKKI